MNRRAGLPLIALVLVSCSDPLDVDFGSGPLIQTDASTYTIIDSGTLLEVSIPVRLENRLPQAIYLQRCSGVALPILERKAGDDPEVDWIHGCRSFCCNFYNQRIKNFYSARREMAPDICPDLGPV